MSAVPTTTATRQFAGLVLARVDGEKLEALRALLATMRVQTLAMMRVARRWTTP